MTALPPPADMFAIQQLVSDFWARTDKVIDAPAEQLFTDDAAMRIGTLAFEGREAIDRYHVDRRAGEEISGRRVRHFCTNMLVEESEADQVRLRCSILVFQGVLPMPFDASLPSNIADFVISCRKVGDRWLLAGLDGTAIFRGPGAPDNAR